MLHCTAIPVCSCSPSEEQARQLLDSVLAGHPEHAAALSDLAYLLIVQGDFEAAREAATRGVKADPTLTDGHAILAYVMNCLAQPHEALRHARAAMKLRPGAPEFYMYAMADALLVLSQYDEAREILLRVLARHREWMTAQALLVICYMRLDQAAAAGEVVEKVVALNPRFTVSRWRQSIMNPQRADVSTLADILTQAGLPP